MISQPACRLCHAATQAGRGDPGRPRRPGPSRPPAEPSRPRRTKQAAATQAGPSPRPRVLRAGAFLKLLRALGLCRHGGGSGETCALVVGYQLVVGHPPLVQGGLFLPQPRLCALAPGLLLGDPRTVLGFVGASRTTLGHFSMFGDRLSRRCPSSRSRRLIRAFSRMPGSSRTATSRIATTTTAITMIVQTGNCSSVPRCAVTLPAGGYSDPHPATRR